MKDEKTKILDGTYSSRIDTRKQAKHIYGSKAFQQETKAALLAKAKGHDYFFPSYFNADENLQQLVNKYKGTGVIVSRKGSEYPWEDIKMDRIIGQIWDYENGKYVGIDIFTIVYSRRGVHIFPKDPTK
ncbi:MAG: polymorphic toxin type 50 domain-containing protein [Firmicutes bacterium]|nr:polymorphic toxin type 50 domain-containing protein [Bacillota bacterium]